MEDDSPEDKPKPYIPTPVPDLSHLLTRDEDIEPSLPSRESLGLPLIDFDDMKLADPEAPLEPTHRQVAKQLAEGVLAPDIAKSCGLTEEKVLELSEHPKIVSQIAEYRDQANAIDTSSRIKEMGDNAANVLEEILRSKTISPLKKAEHAKWILEKIDGKAAQQVDIKGDISVGVFLDRVDNMIQTRKIRDAAPIDILPGTVGEPNENDSQLESPKDTPDSLENWLDQNLD
jgi:hypothetical protein